MRIKKVSDVFRTKVYTDVGDFFGEVAEANLQGNKVDGWKIRVEGPMVSLLSGASGVIVPHKFVKAINDIMIVDKCALPTSDVSINDLTE